MGAPNEKALRLIGREVELGRASQAAEEKSGAAFVGPRSHGKTALVRAAADAAASRGAEVVVLRGIAGTPAIPFAALAATAPQIGLRPGHVPDPLHLLQLFRSNLLRRAGNRQLVLAVEGANLLDPESATLVNQMVTSGVAKLLAAVDTPDVPAALETLWLDGWIDAIEVGPLDRVSTLNLASALLHEMVGQGLVSGLTVGASTLSGELGETLWRLSRGRPTYLRELLTSATRTGRIAHRQGSWTMLAPIVAGPALATAVRAELRPSGPGGLQVLEALALAESLPLDVVTGLYGTNPVADLERRGWVAVTDGPSRRAQVRVAHPLHAAVLLDALPTSESASVAHSLAAAMELAAGGADLVNDTDLITIVRLRTLAGGEETPERLVRAATAAGSDQYWVLSGLLARHAVDHAGEGPMAGPARLALANALRAQGLVHEALEIIGDMVGDDDDERARVAVLKASALHFGLGDHEGAFEILSAAKAAITDPSASIWLKAVEAGLVGFAGDPGDTVALATSLLEDPDLDLRAELTVKFVLCMGLASSGRALKALEVTDGLLEHLGRLSVLSNWAVTARALAHRLAGRSGDIEGVSAQRYERAVARGNRFVQASASATLGWAAMDRGELSRAVASFQEAAVAFRSADSTAIRILTLYGLVEALALSGDPAGAATALEEARVPAERAGGLRPGWSIAAAWVSASKGLMSQAIEQLERAAEEARTYNHVAAEIQALHAAVRLGSADPASRLNELDKSVEGILVALASAHATALGLSTARGDALDDVSGLYADAGLNLYAAEAAAQACHAHQSAGAARKASASAARYHFLLTHGEDGAMPLAVMQALAPPELTRREKEVAMLAARGRPSPAIAEQLCLSVRTVETHLARVYAKLGISGRSELPMALSGPAGSLEVG